MSVAAGRVDFLTASDGARLALHRLGQPDAPRVLLVPGTFSNHTFWLGTRGIGFARTLADAGYEACVLDPRGHGLSDRPARRQHWDIDHWARQDVPTALRATDHDPILAWVIPFNQVIYFPIFGSWK